MPKSIRDEIHNLQLSIFQNYIDIKQQALETNWIETKLKPLVQEKYEENHPARENYRCVKNIIDANGDKYHITVKDLDLTILGTLLRFDWAEECKINEVKDKKYKDLILKIVQDKNVLVSHISNLEDIPKIIEISVNSLKHLREFLIDIKSCEKDNQELLNMSLSYLARVEALYPKLEQELNFKRVRIEVKDQLGNRVPDYVLMLYREDMDFSIIWKTTQEPISLCLLPGRYKLEERENPSGYQRENTRQDFEILESQKNERTINKNVLRENQEGFIINTIPSASPTGRAINYSNLTVEQQVAKGKDFIAVKNFPEAWKCFFLAAEKGNEEAKAFLVKLCYKQLGEAGELQSALNMLENDSQAPSPDILYYLGLIYKYGKGVPIDQEKTFAYHLKAAKTGYALAQNSVGSMYYNGDVVKKDYSEAVRWFILGAEQGNASAEYNLGICYYYGRGVESNEEQGCAWLSKAAAKGNKQAKEALTKINYYNQDNQWSEY